MTHDQIVFLLAGVAVGVDACLLVHFIGRARDDRRARRAADARRGARIDEEQQ